MTSGYLSREAVNDLLAIKEGEKDFLIRENKRLLMQVTELEERIAQLENIASATS